MNPHDETLHGRQNDGASATHHDTDGTQEASENGPLHKHDTLSIKPKATNYTHACVMINFKRNKHGIRDEDDGVGVMWCWGGGTTWLDVGYHQDSGFRLGGGGGWFHGVCY